jgi:hypothetical protein
LRTCVFRVDHSSACQQRAQRNGANPTAQLEIGNPEGIVRLRASAEGEEETSE